MVYKSTGYCPYFDKPFYVGVNVDGYEPGLDPNGLMAEGSTLTCWGVPDIGVRLQQLLDLDATTCADVQEVDDGINVAASKNPFGTVVGLIENPHVSLP